MPRLLPLLLLLLVTLSGCVEAEEDWTFDGKGGGTYSLVVRWNADLWRRIQDVLGAKVMRRMTGDGFPLRPAEIQDGLRGLPGVSVTRLEEREAGAGMRELAVAVRFERLDDLLRWEVLAGRTVQAGPEAPAASAAQAPPTHVRFAMEPIARVPVLDRVAALLEAEARPPPAAPRARADADPGPLAREGIAREAGELVGRMLKPALEGVRLRVRVRVPGPIVSVRGRPASADDGGAAFAWTFADLRKADADRTVRLRWALRTLDVAPTATHTGRRDPRPRGPTGTR